MRSLILSATLCLSSGTLLLSSCASDEVSARLGAGRIHPKLTVSPDVIFSDDVNQSIAIATVPAAADFSLMLLDETSGQSHVWSHSSEFSINDLYRTGPYTITTWYGDYLGEGFDAAFFYGKSSFEVRESQISMIPIECKLYNTMIDFGFDRSVTDFFEEITVIVHSASGAFINYPHTESRPLFLRPGDIWLALNVRDKDGREAVFKAADITDAMSGYYYHVQLSIAPTGTESGEPILCMSFSELIETDDIYIPLTPELFEGTPPVVTYSGFKPDDILKLPEGTLPSEPVLFSISSPTLKSVILSTQSMEVILNGWPNEVDLMELSEENLRSLASLGFNVERTATSITADFTHLLPELNRDAENPLLTFTVLAIDSDGRMSEPISLLFEPTEVEVKVVNEPQLTAGASRGSVILQSSGNIDRERLIIETKTESNDWIKAPILDLLPLEDGTTEVGFAIDPADTDNVEVRITYCGTIRYDRIVRRKSPQYSVEIDAYARKANIHIIPFNPDMRAYIVRNVTVYVDGKIGTVINRNVEDGMLTLSGLTENTSYSIRLSVIDHPEEEDFTMTEKIHTERAIGLPNGNFEDIEKSISKTTIDCGGRYSQNFVEIYNRQNKRTFEVNVPQKWACTNAKTFSREARTHNTWYMQPSVSIVEDAYSGAYAVCLTSVGWDTAGEPIPDYLQESQPFVEYSRIVPDVRFRAVGKLFIGQYSFNAADNSERYVEGMSISARPSALNGFYKYVPSESMIGDKGLISIEVFGNVDGENLMIASAKATLNPATDYTAFTVPLTYQMFGIKASSIRVMIASSSYVGTIEEESSQNLTGINLPDACMLGSSLWVDQLSLSY